MDGGREVKRKGLELALRRCYQPSRTARTVLASVYEQIVVHGRVPRPAWRRTAEPDVEQDVSQPQQILCAGG
jgi:hypothetical protein